MDESARRIVVLGKTGAGKSSIGNTLCGEQVFDINHYASSGTSKCHSKTKSISGRTISFIDTPGFFDTRSKDEMKNEIANCITECAPGPHVFLIVLKVEKYTEHEKAVIEEMRQYFSDEALRFATIIFTHGDQLPEGMMIEQFVNENQDLSELIKKCGGRCHVIDNKYWKNNKEDEYRSNKYQVKELLKTIDKLFDANKGRYFTNEMLQEVRRDIEQEKGCIKQLSPDIPEEETAKKAASRNLLVKFGGVTAGALLGAFLAAKLAKEEKVAGIVFGLAVGTVAGAAAMNVGKKDAATASVTVPAASAEPAAKYNK